MIALLTSTGHLSLYPWLLKFTEIHSWNIFSYSSNLCLLMLLVWVKKKEKDDQSYWLASRRGLKKYLCVTILSHFSVVTMRICLRYPFVRILETNTQERWVNSIKPVIEKETENFQKWGNVKEQKKKKKIYKVKEPAFLWLELQKLTWKRAGESLSQLVDTQEITHHFLTILCSEMLIINHYCIKQIIFKTSSLMWLS